MNTGEARLVGLWEQVGTLHPISGVPVPWPEGSLNASVQEFFRFFEDGSFVFGRFLRDARVAFDESERKFVCDGHTDKILQGRWRLEGTRLIEEFPLAGQPPAIRAIELGELSDERFVVNEQTPLPEFVLRVVYQKVRGVASETASASANSPTQAKPQAAIRKMVSTVLDLARRVSVFTASHRTRETRASNAAELAVRRRGGCSMALPLQLTFHDYIYLLDGGTISLQATDEASVHHDVVLGQHSSPNSSPSGGAIPGRLYFDGELVPIRSELESQLLQLFRASDVRYTPRSEGGRGERVKLSYPAMILGEDIQQVLARRPEDNVRSLLGEVIRFVESEEYVSFAARVEQADDTTRYDVWVAWEPDERIRAIVKVGTELGIRVRADREMLDQGLPVARVVPAPEVVRLSSEFRRSGLGFLLYKRRSE